jgi:hypothetical protein
VLVSAEYEFISVQNARFTPCDNESKLSSCLREVLIQCTSGTLQARWKCLKN